MWCSGNEDVAKFHNVVSAAENFNLIDHEKLCCMHPHTDLHLDLCFILCCWNKKHLVHILEISLLRSMLFMAAGTFAIHRQTHLRSHWFMELPRRAQWAACNEVHTARCSSNQTTNWPASGFLGQFFDDESSAFDFDYGSVFNSNESYSDTPTTISSIETEFTTSLPKTSKQNVTSSARHLIGTLTFLASENDTTAKTFGNDSSTGQPSINRTVYHGANVTFAANDELQLDIIESSASGTSRSHNFASGNGT